MLGLKNEYHTKPQLDRRYRLRGYIRRVTKCFFYSQEFTLDSCWLLDFALWLGELSLLDRTHTSTLMCVRQHNPMSCYGVAALPTPKATQPSCFVVLSNTAQHTTENQRQKGRFGVDISELHSFAIPPAMSTLPQKHMSHSIVSPNISDIRSSDGADYMTVTHARLLYAVVHY